MRKLLLLMVLLCIAVPIAAQNDPATCERAVGEAFRSAGRACIALTAGQLCYGAGNLTAIPRYVTDDFAFAEPGTLLDIAALQSLNGEPYNPNADAYSVALFQTSADLPTDFPDAVTVMSFGNVVISNNVVAAFEVDVTVNTLVNITEQPSALSATLAALAPEDTLKAISRTGSGAITADTWVQVEGDFGSGWLPAFAIEEDYLILSLSEGSATGGSNVPLSALTFASGGADRGCANGVDSGIIVQTPASLATLEVNGLGLTFAPNSTLYAQALPNATLDLYVLEGGLEANFQDERFPVAAGQVLSAPVDLQALVSAAPLAPVAYAADKVTPLNITISALPRFMVIVPGSTNVVAAVPPMVAPAVAVVAVPTLIPTPVVSAPVVEVAPPTVAPEIAPPPAEVVVQAPVVAQPITIESASTTATSEFANNIRTRGIIRVGVNGSLPALSVNNGGQYSGLEPALAQELVLRLFGTNVQIEWVEVSARQRETVLVDGSVDVMIRNSELLPERVTWGEWSGTFYFIDGQRLMVNAASGITDYPNLSGQAVGVQAGSPAETVLNDVAATYGFTVQPVTGVPADLLNALVNGQVSAISADWTTLEALRVTAANPADLVTVGELLTSAPFSIVVPPTQTAWRDDVDRALIEVINDGTLLGLYQANFTGTLPPTIEFIFAPIDGAVVPVAPPPQQQAAVPPPADSPPNVGIDQIAAPTLVPTETPLPAGAPPIVGEVPVTIFTAQNQLRTVRIIPEGDSFALELVRLGEVVYTGRYRVSEDPNRWNNPRNSSEYISFSPTAGDTSLGCGRAPDISGFFNGATFEGRVGC